MSVELLFGSTMSNDPRRLLEKVQNINPPKGPEILGSDPFGVTQMTHDLGRMVPAVIEAAVATDGPNGADGIRHGVAALASMGLAHLEMTNPELDIPISPEDALDPGTVRAAIGKREAAKGLELRLSSVADHRIIGGAGTRQGRVPSPVTRPDEQLPDGFLDSVLRGTWPQDGKSALSDEALERIIANLRRGDASGRHFAPEEVAAQLSISATPEQSVNRRVRVPVSTIRGMLVDPKAVDDALGSYPAGHHSV